MIYFGLDLGKTQDHSALVAVERREHGLDWMETRPEPLRVTYVERMELGLAYRDVVERVRAALGMPGMLADRLVVDATGVGAPVVEMLRAAKLPCALTAVTIVGGSGGGSGDDVRVSKGDLWSGIEALLEQKMLKIPRTLRGSELLMRELETIDRGTGRAEGSGHDDVAMALALACWKARQKRWSLYGGNRLPGI